MRLALTLALPLLLAACDTGGLLVVERSGNGCGGAGGSADAGVDAGCGGAD